MTEYEEDVRPTGKFLVVDDDELIRNVWKKALERNSHQVVTFESPLEALDYLQVDTGDVAILDHMMPEMTGIELLQRIKVHWPRIEVVMMTGYASIETALSAMRAGAYDYLQKPFEQIEVAVRTVEKALERKKLIDRHRELEDQLEAVTHFEGVIGSSPRMQEVFQLVEQVAAFDATVMLNGETGVGKERIARMIHMKSPRRNKPFVPVVCSAFPENLIESTLFGHRKGAFTGATVDKVGLVETADGGTLFLDEIGDIPLSIQIKLLRMLQEREYQRLGDVKCTSVNLRVLTATHRNLREEIKAGRFREDLYYRLNVVEIELPPLRDRLDDIPLLARHFLHSYGKMYNKEINQISTETMILLQSYAWPGNVRQLEHTMAHALIMEQSEEITPASLPKELRGSDALVERSYHPTYLHMSFREAKKFVLERFEKRYIEEILKEAGGNISEAARHADMDRANFRRLLKRNEIHAEEQRGS